MEEQNQTTKVESKYKFEPLTDKHGFSIEKKETDLKASVFLENNEIVIETPIYKQRYDAILKLHEIIEQLGNYFGSKIKVKEEAKQKQIEKYGDYKIPHNLIKWAVKKTQIGISKRVSKYIKEYIYPHINEKLLKLHKKVFSVIGPKNYYKNAEKITETFNDKTKENFINDCLKYNPPCISFSEYGDHKHENWINSFAKGNKPTPSLIKTLYNINYPIRKNLLRSLKQIKLEKEIKNRTELMFLLCVIDKILYSQNLFDTLDINNFSLIDNCHIKTVQFSTKQDIIKAKQKYERYANSKLDLRKTTHITELASFIVDYRETHNCKLPKLIERSIKWHREHRYKDLINGLNPEEKTKTPPIELPKTEGITFLQDVQQVVDEGVKMNHCVGGYAKLAVNGFCYLFHIDYNNETATAEVSQSGEIRQIRGPFNKTNNACKWGERQLNKWCKLLRDKQIYDGPKEAYAEIHF